MNFLLITWDQYAADFGVCDITGFDDLVSTDVVVMDDVDLQNIRNLRPDDYYIRQCYFMVVRLS